MRHVAVDWSGAKNPAGKIWLAEAVDGRLERLEALATREAAVQRIAAYQRFDEQTIVGLDFSFSFPEWFCRELGAQSVLDVWRAVAASGEGWLEQCAAPFWGRPGRRRPDLIAHLRKTEERVREFECRPTSTFQIGGAGAVGTGSLRGMPHLLTLRDTGCAVWPFDTPGHVTLIEIYPRLLTGPVTKSREAARAAYLDAVAASWNESHRREAEQSEDAFDAAISALEMNARATALTPHHALDDVAKIEGEIWVPAAVPPSASRRLK